MRNVNDRRIIRVIALLNAKPRSGIEDLAASVSLSRSRLRHLFRKEVQTSLIAYCTEVRLQLACRLLATTDQSIKEIRYEVGIPNGPNFVRYFKRRFGLAPSAYRRLHCSRFDEQLAELTNSIALSPAESFMSTADGIQNDN